MKSNFDVKEKFQLFCDFTIFTSVRDFTYDFNRILEAKHVNGNSFNNIQPKYSPYSINSIVIVSVNEVTVACEKTFSNQGDGI